MDAFFASVEILDHPEWRGKPVIVGSGPHERGVVSTCSYEARKFGVHSAMPSRMAYAKCPQAIFTPPNMARYQEISRRVFEIFGEYSPYVEGVSIDEAFLDITGNVHFFRNGFDDTPIACARRLGEALRAEIKAKCGVTCSVGIAPNRLLAKIGSEQHKPDGLTVMPFEEQKIAAFLKDQPITILWGVGKVMVEMLRTYGIVTCGDLQRLSQQELPASMMVDWRGLIELAFGRCEDTVYWESVAEKSVSREFTFGEDESNRNQIRAKLLELVDDVGRRFRREKRWACTARIKIRDASFHTFTRQMPFKTPVCDDIAFRATALKLFDAQFSTDVTIIKPIRLIGFGVTNIVDKPKAIRQLSLFEDATEDDRKKRERLSAVIDKLKDRGFRMTIK